MRPASDRATDAPAGLSATRDPNFKILGLFKALKATGGGPMIFEIIGTGFVVVAAALAAIIFERRKDVLFGPFIETDGSDASSRVEI
jgi:hypothetical protein